MSCWFVEPIAIPAQLKFLIPSPAGLIPASQTYAMLNDQTLAALRTAITAERSLNALIQSETMAEKRVEMLHAQIALLKEIYALAVA